MSNEINLGGLNPQATDGGWHGHESSKQAWRNSIDKRSHVAVCGSIADVGRGKLVAL